MYKIMNEKTTSAVSQCENYFAPRTQKEHSLHQIDFSFNFEKKINCLRIKLLISDKFKKSFLTVL